MGEGKSCPEEVGVGKRGPFAMGKFSPTKQHGNCEEIANPSTAYGRRTPTALHLLGKCRCVVLQPALHRAEARLPLCSRRAAGHVPQDRRPRSQAQSRSAFSMLRESVRTR
jgi:hypothetical protein